MKIFDKKALRIYQVLKIAGHDLDVNKVVIPEEVYQMDLVEEQVRPKSPRTGVRYANLMLSLLEFDKSRLLDRNATIYLLL